MSDHTKGPWKVQQTNVGLVILNSEDESLANVGKFRATQEEVQANARLMCAAPDLLAICEEFVRRVECGEVRSRRTYAAMQDIIQKVKGEA